MPENEDRIFELIGGEIFDALSTPYSSEIAVQISFFIQLFLRENGIKSHVTVEAGLYRVIDERYTPDVAYLSAEQQGTLPYESWYNPIPPQLAVEVVSPTDKEQKLMRKVGNYLAAGTVVWVVYPIEQQVEIYAPGQAVKVLDVNDSLSGSNILPGFTLKVSEIFPNR